MGDERTSLEIIAPDIETARARAQIELGVDASSLEIEILDAGDSAVGRDGRFRVFLVPAGDAPDDPLVATSRRILTELLEHMEVEAKVYARYGDASKPDEEPPILLDVQGQELGAIIGRRGETLAALQYIVRIIAARELNGPVNIIVDVEGYKSRREKQLRRLAQRMAEQALQRGRTVSLEPMPANERRIIHLELHDHPQVTTESVGEGNRRKVTIIPRPPSETPQ